MSCIYHFQARKRLKQDKWDGSTPLASVCSSAEDLLNLYFNRSEKSDLAKMEFYSTLKNRLSTYYNLHVYAHKSFWKKILYFIGWLSNEEQRIFSSIEKLSKLIDKAHNHINTKNPLSKEEMVAFQDLEQKILSTRHFLQSDLERQLRYLSHRTLHEMYNTPATLEGYSDYQSFNDYCDDINQFIQTSNTHLNSQQINPFENIYGILMACKTYEADLLLLQYKEFYLEKHGRAFNIGILQDQTVANTTFKIGQAIAELKIGEIKLFSHGYRSDNGGHGTLFSVTKVNEEEVVFRFIDTGGSSEAVTTNLHLSAFEKNRLIKITSPLSLASLLNPVQENEDLISQLMIPKIKKLSDKKMLAPLLNLQKNHLLHDDNETLKLQTIGSCAQSRIDAWVKTQVTEPQFLSFNAYRQKQVLIKIETLLQNHDLNPEQKKQCQHMRMAANLELQVLKDRNKEISTEVQKNKSITLEILQEVRKQNSSHKDRPPRALEEANIEIYCLTKLTPSRLKAKFNVQEQQLLTSITPHALTQVASANNITEAKATFGPSVLGFFSKIDPLQLTPTHRTEAKLKKVLLAKKILVQQGDLKEIQTVQQMVTPSQLTQEEQERLLHLSTYKKNKVPSFYQLLDPKTPIESLTTLIDEVEQKHQHSIRSSLANYFTERNRNKLM